TTGCSGWLIGPCPARCGCATGNFENGCGAMADQFSEGTAFDCGDPLRPAKPRLRSPSEAGDPLRPAAPRLRSTSEAGDPLRPAAPRLRSPVTLERVEDTIALGARLGEQLRAGDVVVLSGPLGAGKTVLARGIAEALEVDG